MTSAGRPPPTKRRVARAGVVESSNSGIDAQLRALIAPLVAAEVKRQLAEATAPAEFMSAQEAAEFARVSDGCVRRWIREGKLVGHRAGRVLRVKREDLENLMRGGGRGDDEDLTPEQEARRDLASRGLA